MTTKKSNTFIIVLFLLLVFGLVILASATAVVGYADFGNNYYYLKHQILFGLLPGLILFLICAKIPYTFWKKNALLIFLFSLLLLALVFVPGISKSNENAQSWLNIAGASLQPSELAKLALIIYLSAWFAKSKEHVRSFSHGLLPFVIFLGLAAGLIALQPDIGTLSIIILIAVGIYFVAGAKLSHLFGLILLGSCLFTLLIKIDPDGKRLNRFLAFVKPGLDPQGIGYHISQALLAIGSGGLLGLGLGHSRQKFQYLPEVAGDSIFAVMAEEVGFVVCLLFLILLVYFVAQILKTAKEAKDDFVKFLAVGLAVWIGGQSIINIGAMVGLLPLTGVPLPFVSFGGTALFSLLAGCGIIVNALKH